MTPSTSLLHAISGLTAPKPAAPQAATPKPAPEPLAASTAPRDGSAMPKTFDPSAPRGRYLDIVA